ncbi:GUN4 domain-containing protein [Saccharothrix isguenensis]
MSLVERFVVGVDIQGFSSRVARTQVVLQAALNRMLGEAAASVGLDRELWTRHPGGDGEVAVLPADVDLLAVVRRFVTELDTGLTDHNEDHGIGARIRLRVAMHTDVVTKPGPLGYAGPALTVLSRLLDSDAVRAALARAPEANLAQIISADLYRKAVLPELGGLRPRQFRQVRVDVPDKGFDQTAYLYVPREGTARPEPPRDPEPPGIPLLIKSLRATLPPPTPPPGRGREAAGREAAVEVVEPAPADLAPEVRDAVREAREALARDDLRRADAMTTWALLAEAGRGRNGWLRRSDGELLTDALLTELDLAWSDFSGGEAGFRAQRARLGGLALSGPKEFRELSVRLGWRTEREEVISRYGEFGRRSGATADSFHPTLRNPEREDHATWHDEWSSTVMAVHVRLQRWEG